VNEEVRVTMYDPAPGSKSPFGRFWTGTSRLGSDRMNRIYRMVPPGRAQPSILSIL
jgi:hypothetical protein